MARLALEHFEKYPDRSLGIVAMNTAQREAIEDAIQEELQERVDLQPFFDASRPERVDQFGMMREQIPQVIGRLFGVERLRGDSADAIRSSVDALVEKGLLRTSGPHVYIA